MSQCKKIQWHGQNPDKSLYLKYQSDPGLRIQQSQVGYPKILALVVLRGRGGVGCLFIF